MKNHRDLFGLFANIIIVVLVLAGIIVGLNYIGVYDLPDPIERLLGTAKLNDDTDFGQENRADDFLDYEPDNDISIGGSEVSYSNARQLLSSVKPDSDYVQEMSSAYYSDGNYLEERMTVVCSGGLYDISVYDKDSRLVKHIKEDAENVTVSKPLGGMQKQYTLSKGSVSVVDECGVLLNCDSFLQSDYQLDRYGFSITDSEFGSCAVIEFESDFDGYTQREIYTVSLDFGVVISAECFENEKVVYSMTTKSLVNQRS